MSTGVRLAAVACVTPPYSVAQHEAKAVAEQWFRGHPAGFDRVARVFHHPALRRRQLARPLAWYTRHHSFVDKNAAYCEVALDLMAQAGGEALARAQVAPNEVASLVVATSTGVSTPSLDATLLQRLDLPRSIARVPLWGLGCAGGAAALARAMLLVRGTGRPALVVAAEFCSLTFVAEDKSPANMVATAIFGDGVAAAVLVPSARAPGIELLGSLARVFDDSQDMMGWDVVPEGFKVRFAPSIPRFVRRETAGFFSATCRAVGVEPNDVVHYALHPGGPKVLEAYTDAMALREEQIADAWAVLADHGNMSGPTVLFVLDKLLRRPPPPGQVGLLAALGPGFAAEATVFRT
ncbi:MAG: stilbene synthase [Myxococcales bacterium FL481]|nr:MAG: stilbene synthase [Myxococcales bacterium FL481]